MIDLQAIEAREKAATPGPWRKWLPTEHSWFAVCGKRGLLESTVIAWLERWVEGRDSKDAEFIAHARTDIPTLIAEVRRLEKEQYEDRVTARREDKATMLQLKRYRELAKSVVFADIPKLKDVAAELLKEVKPPSEDLRGVSEEVHDA
jgi:hypothetical protein